MGQQVQKAADQGLMDSWDDLHAPHFYWKTAIKRKMGSFKTCTFEATPVMGKVWGSLLSPGVLQGEVRRCPEPCKGIKENLWAGPGAGPSPG